MVILHANWTRAALYLWAELHHRQSHASDSIGHGSVSEVSGDDNGRSSNVSAQSDQVQPHPFALEPQQLLQTASAFLQHAAEPADVIPSDVESLNLVLPSAGGRVLPSVFLSIASGEEQPIEPDGLVTCRVPAVALPHRALPLLVRAEHGDTVASHSVRYWAVVVRFVLDLLADQRFVPTLVQSRSGPARGLWVPWLHDDDIRRYFTTLACSMPPAVRAVVDDARHQPWSILEDAVTVLTDAYVREALALNRFAEVIDGQDHAPPSAPPAPPGDPTGTPSEGPDRSDPVVGWLRTLLSNSRGVGDADRSRTDELDPSIDAVETMRDVRRWLGRLVDVQNRPYRLKLTLREPSRHVRDGSAKDHAESWHVDFSLIGEDGTEIGAADIWSSAATGGSGAHEMDVESVLLRELGQASRLFPKLKESLEEAAPTRLQLTTAQAYDLLREHREILAESNVVVEVPAWWDQPQRRLGLRMVIEADAATSSGDSSSVPAGFQSMFGLDRLVRYHWEVMLGDRTMSLEEFEQMAGVGSGISGGLVLHNDQWVEINPDDVNQARRFLSSHPGGTISAGKAIRMAFGLEDASAQLPIHGLHASGWIERLFGIGDQPRRLEPVEQPASFQGTLRPYQRTGLSWLAFLESLGFGPTLADDMGLGKTIQLIALLLHERERHDVSNGSHQMEREEDFVAAGNQSRDAGTAGQQPDIRFAPTLLIVPTSVLSNWARELERFSPSLRYHVQHGLDRPVGDHFVSAANAADVVLTTYALIGRDVDTLHRVRWHRIVLDEAQYIKNPPTQQARAIRRLATEHSQARRIAMTGTPIENRLSELWSIMDFCNPGLLGSRNEFRKSFVVPIERKRDQRRAEQLRRFVQPFILRRLKSDPTVIDDLPECLETRTFATLTPEQAALYERTVADLLARTEAIHENGGREDTMKRRGLVLAGLVRLKQICNHPLQLPHEHRQHGNGSEVSNATRTDGTGSADEAIEQESQVPAASRSALLNPAQSESPPGRLLADRSGKCRRLLDMLEEVLAEGDQALIFTQFRVMGQLLSTMIQQELDRNVLFLHGGTPQNKRQPMVDRFQQQDGSHPIFILSLRAGGIGLNLTAANHVFHFDRWWNPAVEKQATDRAFRIGQKRTVHVHKFVTIGTLEERIDEMIEMKTELADNIVGSGEEWLTELSTSELRDLLTLRQSALENEE